MKVKFILFAFTTTLLSSCCWLVHDDCIEDSELFSIPVTINYMDSTINVNEPLAIRIVSSAFQSTYDDNGLNQSSFSLNITWFDGNFTSQANHKVDILSSNVSGFTTQEYNGFSGPLPQDIELELGFTVPGYYLIQFNGGASGYLETKQRRCQRCGDYSYTNFQFESNLTNSQYFNLYKTSISYPPSLADLNFQGAYFIKVE